MRCFIEPRIRACGQRFGKIEIPRVSHWPPLTRHNEACRANQTADVEQPHGPERGHVDVWSEGGLERTNRDEDAKLGGSGIP